jgi:hypothetical protein
MVFRDNVEYTKDCRNFTHVGVGCCQTCHSDPEYAMAVVQVDGEPTLLCCMLRAFFYPGNPNQKLSPEEKLLRAIFGEAPHVQDLD